MSTLRTNYGATLILNSGINLLTDTIKVALLSGAYTPSKTDKFMSAATAAELSGTGYVAGFGGSGRQALASKTVTQDDTNNLAVFTGATVTWTAINAGTVSYVALLKEITSDAASPLLAVIAISPAFTTNGADYSVAWDAVQGIINLS